MSANEINFVETDAGKLYDLVISSLMEHVREPLYPGDERRIFGEGFVAVVVALMGTVNDQCRQSLLRYARGAVLDAMGERVRCFRLEASPAKCGLRYAVAAPLQQNVIIPAGSRVTPNASLYFATTVPAVIRAGETSVEVPAEATVGGSIGNGHRAGSVSSMVDLIPLIARVENTGETHGGDEGEPYTEAGDNRYRERIGLAPAGFSSGGAESAYRYHALSGDPEILDVSIVSDREAGTIDIILLMKDGQGPGEETAAKVLAAANQDTARCMNDLVSVDGPKFTEYDIDIKYYVTAGTETDAVQAVEGPDGAVSRFIRWQGEAIGRDLNPDRLRAMVLCPHWAEGLPGAVRVDVAAPAYIPLGERGVARFSGRAAVTHEIVRE